MRAIISNFAVTAGEQPEYYPIEICFVLPNQRVPLNKMNKALLARLLKVCFYCKNINFNL